MALKMALKMSCQMMTILLILLILLCAVTHSAQRQTGKQHLNDHYPDRESADFDFDDKLVQSSGKAMSAELKQMYNWWTIEDICKDVKCKANEYCVIKSREVALCVKQSAKRDHHLDGNTFTNNDDDDDDDDDDYSDDVDSKSTYTKEDESALKLCTPCAAVKPQFVCASDNSTYSSLCRLDFHNCVHKTTFKLVCKGFCPCLRPPSLQINSKTMNKHSDKHSDKHPVKHKKTLLTEAYNKKWKYYSNKKSLSGKSWGKKVENGKKMHNSVLSMSNMISSKAENKCTADELKAMGTRLLDWFSVVIGEQVNKNGNEKTRNSAIKIPDCHSDVSWMFHHFDTDSDMRLSLKELYYLEHDQSEHCLQPYLSQCDEDNDDFLSAYEWCTCFDTKSSPCSLAVQHLKKGLLGAYTPQCDSEGFFKSTQCHASTGVCWCVDKNGVEFLNSRRKGVPDCKGLLNKARKRTKLNQIDTNDDEEDDDNEENSGDGAIE